MKDQVYTGTNLKDLLKPAEQSLFENLHSDTLKGSREESEDIFFDSPLREDIGRNYIQLKLKKSNQVPVIVENIKEETQIRKILNFFETYPLINLNNFKIAEELLISYLKDPINAENKLARLQEEIDKHSTEKSKFGKLVMEAKLKAQGVRISFYRTKLKDSKQQVAINFNTAHQAALVVYTSWDWKDKKSELIRSKLKSKKEANINSIKFDSKIWRAFNYNGINQINYMKSLDCLDRNHLQLSKFIHEVNRKDILSLMADDLIHNVTIKTDNHDTTFINFKTNTSQKVEIKITSLASSLSIQ